MTLSNDLLIEENARLRGKVKALEYEVEMLTMLAKNLIYFGPSFPDVSSFNKQPHYPATGSFENYDQHEQSTDVGKGIDLNAVYEGTFDDEDDNYKSRKDVKKDQVEEVPKVEDRHQMMLEMRRLYGDELSVEVLSMETSMQSRFNVKCDATMAKMWPCIPLNP